MATGAIYQGLRHARAFFVFRKAMSSNQPNRGKSIMITINNSTKNKAPDPKDVQLAKIEEDLKSRGKVLGDWRSDYRLEVSNPGGHCVF
jgi:hypothetical protein